MTVFSNQNVRRLQIPVNHALTRARNRALLQVQEPSWSAVSSGNLWSSSRDSSLSRDCSPDKFHYNVRNTSLWFLPHIEDGYDSRMRQAARSLGFPQETLAILAFLLRRLADQGDGLHGYHAVDLRIARFIDNTHGSHVPSSARTWYRPKRSFAAIIHGCYLRFPEFRRAAFSQRPLLRLIIRRCSDKHANYVFVQHVQDFRRLCATVIPFSSSKLI
jgi:hypothetical protein